MPASSSLPRFGIVTSADQHVTPDEALARVRRLGFDTCQLMVGTAPELAGPIREAMARHSVEITALMTLGEGRMVWDLREGPLTVGLVPRATRANRVEALHRTSDLAKACGIAAIHTHCGFIPENPNNPLYAEVLEVVREVVAYAGRNGQTFLCETGQETPITLLRLMNDTKLDNIAVNLDMANLILYGKGDPVGALEVLGPRVRGTHAKDGLYPTDPYGLGRETPIGKGDVRFREVFRKLHALGYSGPITIEREISGPEQEADIVASRHFLEGIMRSEWGV